MFRLLCPEAFLTAMLIILTPVAGYSQSEGSKSPTAAGEETAKPDIQSQKLKEIAALYYAGEHESVIKKSQAFSKEHPLTRESFGVLFFQAESHYRLGQIEPAITAYDLALPFIEKLNSIQQRRYAFVFFRMGTLHRQQGRYDAAIKLIEAGLRREPQSIYYQILLGELFKDRGEGNFALKHFNELLGSSMLTTEEKTVIRVKIDRLSSGGVGSSVPLVEMSNEPFYPELSFGIVPLNYAAPQASMRDICALLESKWLIGCEVMPALSLDEDKILDRQRKQYAGDRILQELRRQYPAATRRHRLIVGLVGRDIFGPETNFVFSWQNSRNRVGVVSTYRFLAGLENFYEPQIIATRRLGIQFLSTTGFMLGITRPTKPDCPMAYPHDFREFQQKGSKLCESTIVQRDEVLKARGGQPTRFGAQKSEEINRVYRTYYFE